MKSIQYGIWLFMLCALIACGGGGDDKGSSSDNSVREMEVDQTVSGFIETEGDVDVYHLRPVADSQYMRIQCNEATTGNAVDLLVTVFEEQDNGEWRRIFGKQERDGATISADLDLLIYIDDFDNDLYITVRDYMDDESNEEIPYNLRATLETGPEGNNDFSSARPLDIGGAALRDEIAETGEVDSFTFAPQSDGVYRVNVAHQIPQGMGTDVQLAITLYDNDGNRIQRLAHPQHTILAHLTTADAPYYVIVEDSDSLHGDQGAPYDITAEAVNVAEPQENDIKGSATLIERQAGGVYTAAGTIDYGCASAGMDPETTASNYPDVDWYELVIGTEGGTDFHQVQFTVQDGEDVAGTAPIRVIVYDTEDNIVTSHRYTPRSAAYQNQFRVQDGRYFISVAPFDSTLVSQGINYQVQLTEVELNDGEGEPANNEADNAIPLDGGPEQGVISYHADVDWYSINVNTSVAQIVSVELTTTTPSIVDYQVSIWRGIHLQKRVTDADGSDGPTHLKTSILVPADDLTEPVPFTIRVNDAQNSEGSNVEYTVSATVTPVLLTSPGHLPGYTSGELRYYCETANERTIPDEEMIQLEIFSTQQPTFKVNTDWLDFRANNPASGIQTAPGAGNTTVITFPWICGYADYQGDRDFFKLDLGKLADGPETEWYYELQFRLVVPSGTDTEYVWKLYRDSNANRTFMDNPGAEDGIVVNDGDTSLTDDLVNLTSPRPGSEGPFWIGNVWSGGQDPSMFYFAVSDYEFKRLPDDSENDAPDDDWGYDQPYYFTMTLIYHPGQSSPSN